MNKTVNLRDHFKFGGIDRIVKVPKSFEFKSDKGNCITRKVINILSGEFLVYFVISNFHPLQMNNPQLFSDQSALLQYFKKAFKIPDEAITQP